MAEDSGKIKIPVQAEPDIKSADSTGKILGAHVEKGMVGVLSSSNPLASITKTPIKMPKTIPALQRMSDMNPISAKELELGSRNPKLAGWSKQERLEIALAKQKLDLENQITWTAREQLKVANAKSLITHKENARTQGYIQRNDSDIIKRQALATIGLTEKQEKLNQALNYEHDKRVQIVAAKVVERALKNDDDLRQKQAKDTLDLSKYQEKLNIKLQAEIEKRKQLATLSHGASSASKATGILGRTVERVTGVFSRFNKILSMRLYRMAAMKLIQSMREGLQRVVQWEAQFGASMYRSVETMTKIKSLGDQIQRTLGALGMSVLYAFLPAIQAVANALIWVLNTIQSIVALFKGSDQYLHAPYVEVSALADETERASGAAKELQRVLFGFDELNVLPSPTNRGGAGGTGVLGGEKDFEIRESPIAKLWNEAGKFSKNPIIKSILFGAFVARDVLEWIGENVSAPVIKWVKTKVKPWFKNLWESSWLYAGFKIFKFYLESIAGWLDAYILNPFRVTMSACSDSVALLFDALFHPRKYSPETLKNELVKIWADAGVSILSKQEEYQEEQKKRNDELVKYFEEHPSVGRFVLGTSFDDAVAIPAKEAHRKLAKFLDDNKLNWRSKLETVDIPTLSTYLRTMNVYTSANPLVISMLLSDKGFNTLLSDTLKYYQGQIDKTTGLKVPLTLEQARQHANTPTNYGINRNPFLPTPFASGGDPVSGTLFYAGERGAELVANTRGGTGVMNVSQMQDAVASGNIDVVNAVYAMANMVVRAIQDKDMNAYISEQEIGRAATRYQTNSARRGLPMGV